MIKSQVMKSKMKEGQLKEDQVKEGQMIKDQIAAMNGQMIKYMVTQETAVGCIRLMSSSYPYNFEEILSIILPNSFKSLLKWEGTFQRTV